MRTITALAAFQQDGLADTVYAACNDGTVWQLGWRQDEDGKYERTWDELPSIPQPQYD